jgi:hypothetical protein
MSCLEWILRDALGGRGHDHGCDHDFPFLSRNQQWSPSRNENATKNIQLIEHE